MYLSYFWDFQIITTLAFVFLFVFHWKRRHLYLLSWKCSGPFAWPIIGNALYFAKKEADVTDSILSLSENYTSPVRVWFGPNLYICISSAEDAGRILISPKCLARAHVYDYLLPILGDGLMSAPVDKWRWHRKIIQPTFNQKILDSFVKIFHEQSQVLCENLEKHVGKGEFDIFNYINMCTLDMICETAMGISVNAQRETSRYLECKERMKTIMFKRVFYLWYRFDFIFNISALAKEQEQMVEEIKEFIHSVIKTKRSEIQNKIIDHHLGPNENENNSGKRKAFLELLLELSEEGKQFTDEELIEEVNTFILAGSDSSATADSFIAVLLGVHQDIQDKVLAEIDSVFGDSDRETTPEDLNKLTYLEQVIKEALRMFPTGIVIGRTATEDIQLETIRIPAGTELAISLLSIHRDPKHWPNPMKFDPDRFLPEEISKRHPYAWIPFSGGPRNCIGIRFSMMGMKTLMSTILRKFRFKTSIRSTEDMQIETHLITKLHGGFNVEVEYRKK